jgi:hypothetical protein
MLGYRTRYSSTRPILWREFDAPEMRARREKFYPHAGTLLRSIAQVDHAALLLFLRDRVYEHHVRANLKLFLQVQKASVGVNHDRLAIFAKFLSQDVPTRRANGNSSEYP